MSYTNRNFTWDFDALKRFYEKYIVKWLNSAISWTDAQKKQARANLGFGDGDIDAEPTAGSSNMVTSGGVKSLINNTVNDFAIISNKNPEYNNADLTFTLPKLTNIQAVNKIITCNSDVIFSYSEINDNYSTHFLILNINTLEKRYVQAKYNVVLNENETCIALIRWQDGVLKGNFFSYYKNGELITKLFSESIFADNIIVPTATKTGIAFYYEGKNQLYSKLPLTIPSGSTVKIKLISLVTSDESTSAAFFGKTDDDDDNYVSLQTISIDEEKSTEINIDIKYLRVLVTASMSSYKVLISFGGSEFERLKSDVKNLTDKEEVISYNSSDLESGYFYVPMTTANPYAYGNTNESWKRLALPVYKGDELAISTVGGNNARAYGLANTEYIITSRANSNVTLDNQTLNITEDGYIYLNCNINNIDNFSVIIRRKSQANKPIVAKAFNPPVNLTKVNIRILDIGNSYTNNATNYLPDIINAAGVVSDYSLYKAIRGSGSFKTWTNCYNDTDGNNYSITKVVGNTISEVTEGIGAANDGSLFRSTLAAGWDIILIHQVSTYSNNFDMWEHPKFVSPASGLKEFIRILRKTNPNACIGFLMIHSYNANYADNLEGSSLDRWQSIVKCTKEFTTKYGIDFIIPYGTAVQNLRASSLNDDNEFCSDGSHLADGIGCYVASCCYYQSIFAPRTGISILGNTFRKTDLDETSPGVKNINDTNAALAQKAAFAACYDRYDIKNPEYLE